MVLVKNLLKYPSLPDEIWKDVVGYEGLYKVSTKGRVRSFVKGGKRGCILSQATHRQGYKEIRLSSCSKGNKMFLVHRLVVEAFIPNPYNKETVNHIDGNKANNMVENLKWATINENIAHAYRTELRVFPEQRLSQLFEGSKLTKHDVEDIRNGFAEGVLQKDLASKYGVSRAHICRIVHNKIRKHC